MIDGDWCTSVPQQQRLYSPLLGRVSTSWCPYFWPIIEIFLISAFLPGKAEADKSGLAIFYLVLSILYLHKGVYFTYTREYTLLTQGKVEVSVRMQVGPVVEGGPEG